MRLAKILPFRRAPIALRASPPSLDDSQLLTAVRDGDGRAATALYDRCRTRIESAVVRLTGRHHPDHDDLVQTSFIELVWSLDGYRAECSLDTWVATVAARVVYKHLRKAKSDARLFDTSMRDALDATASDDPRRTIALRDLIGRIRGHLARMEQSKAWTFVLHEVCGYDLREIADITEVTVAAAQRRLVRGRNELHDRIASDPELASLITEYSSEESDR